MYDSSCPDSVSLTVDQCELREPVCDPKLVLCAFLSITHPPVTHGPLLVPSVHIRVTLN